MTSAAPGRSPIRVAVVGAGLMGRWHADAARRLGAEVVGVADPDRAAALALGAPAFDSLGDLLSAVCPDVVHLCTPLATHVALATHALQVGAHVLVEKPLAPTAADTEAVLQAAADAGRLVCPVHQFPCQDGAVAAKAGLARLGRVVQFDARFCSAGADGPGTPDPDAVVADVLPHPLSLLQALLPGHLGDAGWTALRAGPGELLAVAVLGEVTSTVGVSMAGRPTEARARLVGTEGAVELDLYHGYARFETGEVSRRRKMTLPFERGAGHLRAAASNIARRAVRREPAYPGLRTLIKEFYRACLGTAPPPISVRDIREAAQVRDTILTRWRLKA